MKLHLLIAILLISTSNCFAKNKRILDLADQGISDVSNLEIKDHVRIIFLFDNDISDVSSLVLPQKLNLLSLSRNQITDITNLNLPDSLKNLNLSGNLIRDFSSLTNLPILRRLLIGEMGLDNENFSFDFLPSSVEILSITSNEFVSLDLRDFTHIRQVGIKSNLNLDYSQVFLPETLEVISLGNISAPDDFTSLVLPESTKEISFLADFLSNDELKTMSFPPNVRKINLRLNSLTSLDGIELPDSLRKLNLKRNNFSKEEKRKIRRRFGKKVKIKF